MCPRSARRRQALPSSNETPLVRARAVELSGCHLQDYPDGAADLREAIGCASGSIRPASRAASAPTTR
jgi:hypothetical protein